MGPGAKRLANPQRPLASGLFQWVPLYIFGVLGAIGIGILWQLPICLYVGWPPRPCLVIPGQTRYPVSTICSWTNIFLGSPAWLGSQHRIATRSINFIYLCRLCVWVFGYDTIYAVQDMADDAAIGIKPFGLAFAQHLKIAVGLAYGLAFSLLLLGFYLKLGIDFGWAASA
ncbi:MAG: hypothetical protein CM15mP46_3770 [Alphaproteobacteria bacterium]|nr:MAG: hypothetical protein CM15mP46_3770 [Alphaproteobacteria bacterium]